MKGIILAGGTGSRLWPITNGVSKQLLPVYDKPMIYYPLSILMLSGIRDILIIAKKNEIKNYKSILGNGKHLGVRFKYLQQNQPKGIAEAFIIGKKFIGKDSVCLILGDNIFYGEGFIKKLKEASNLKDGCKIFAYPVIDPENFGIIEINEQGIPLSIKEKPKKMKSNLAVTGLYFYDNSVLKVVKKIKPSRRGELEITSINNIFLKKKKLKVEIFGRGFAWLDTGNCNSLIEAGKFVQTIQQRQGLKIACVEKIALSNGWISKNDIKKFIKNKKIDNEYFRYLKKILKNDFPKSKN